MDSQRSSPHNLFEVYLRLRPPPSGGSASDRILTVEPPESNDDHIADRPVVPSHIVLNPPSDRRRAIEKFGFTRVFEEDASQLDVFHCAEVVPMLEGVLAPEGGEGTDAMVATLGVTGSGKTHTILGSKTQRGLTQLALDVLFSSIESNMVDPQGIMSVTETLQAYDASESTLLTAANFLESPEPQQGSRSRAATPMLGESFGVMTSSTRLTRTLTRPSAMPQVPDVSNVNISCDPNSVYVVVVSMYEVHNDRIYDLLTTPIKSNSSKDVRRRPLLFKSTELSPDRKVVAGLRKVVCTSFREAIMVLEAGLQERRVTGTGSNSTSSRSHGFFCFEVKKKSTGRRATWTGSRLTIVDLAGSERARDAKTAGATLVEAGKINESLMYLGQCLQTQSEVGNSNKPNIVPYRQCKLTELLFSNSFPTSTASHNATRRNPQRGVMIVTADPHGDYNATSQILRYSALAREVTVPRIPSITAAILSNPLATTGPPASTHQSHHKTFMPPGASNGAAFRMVSADERATMELAALEIARLSDEIDQLRAEVEHQFEARMEAEAHLLSMEDRMLDLECAIRDDCASEFEQRLEIELARFKASLAVEQERNDDHWDKKVDVLERGLDEGSADDKENILIENLEEEVERLRRENDILRREVSNRSPTRRRPLGERDEYAASSPPSSPTKQHDGVSKIERRLEKLKVSGGMNSNNNLGHSSQQQQIPRFGGNSGMMTSGGASPKKVMRKLGNKRWEDDELE